MEDFQDMPIRSVVAKSDPMATSYTACMRTQVRILLHDATAIRSCCSHRSAWMLHSYRHDLRAPSRSVPLWMDPIQIQPRHTPSVGTASTITNGSLRLQSQAHNSPTASTPLRQHLISFLTEERTFDNCLFRCKKKRTTHATCSLDNQGSATNFHADVERQPCVTRVS
jgi:hypothetical protein